MGGRIFSAASAAHRWAAAVTLVGGLVLLPGALDAQAPQVETAAGTQELGVDAGLTFGVGDQSSVAFSLPAARARVGFFMSQNSRWSLEPAVGLNYSKTEGTDGALIYNVEAGALYHWRAPGELMSRGARVAYLRPFLGLVGVTGEDGDSEVSAGVGFGVKVPWRQALAWRLEANTGYGFDNQAWRLGANVGVCFFTQRPVIR